MNMNYAELNEQKRQKINEDRERETPLLHNKIRFVSAFVWIIPKIFSYP